MEKTVKKVSAKVVSNMMEKTSVVKITRQIKHPKYGKFIKKTTKLMVHDENKHNIGETVLISPCKPFSKNKSWIIVN